MANVPLIHRLLRAGADPSRTTTAPESGSTCALNIVCAAAEADDAPSELRALMGEMLRAVPLLRIDYPNTSFELRAAVCGELNTPVFSGGPHGGLMANGGAQLPDVLWARASSVRTIDHKC